MGVKAQTNLPKINSKVKFWKSTFPSKQSINQFSAADNYVPISIKNYKLKTYQQNSDVALVNDRTNNYLKFKINSVCVFNWHNTWLRQTFSNSCSNIWFLLLSVLSWWYQTLMSAGVLKWKKYFFDAVQFTVLSLGSSFCQVHCWMQLVATLYFPSGNSVRPSYWMLNNWGMCSLFDLNEKVVASKKS